ncbi:hypothetical protein ABZZ74_48600 [Streptomyces sp. NPDC006476]|uniref:hypothetical protein n=1 Tax=Streptomyces sp. NPDC006476 TaxID=3157175 RepID=UPI0033BF72FB
MFGHVRYNAVNITADGLPDDGQHRITSGSSVRIAVSVANTTGAGHYLFLDPRLATPTTLPLTQTAGTATPVLPGRPMTCC